MSNDKRSVSTDALETLGTIIDEKAGRDAIHLAVEPAIAAEKLYPGQDVGFIQGGVGKCDTPLGIVDPFLKAPVQPGERFWFVVYPRQITSLRHVWTHPAFSETPQNSVSKAASERWLREFVPRIGGPDYETVIYNASHGANDGDALCFGEEIDGEREIPPEFWDHVEVVTGKKISAGQRASYFRCAC